MGGHHDVPGLDHPVGRAHSIGSGDGDVADAAAFEDPPARGHERGREPAKVLCRVQHDLVAQPGGAQGAERQIQLLGPLHRKTGTAGSVRFGEHGVTFRGCVGEGRGRRPLRVALDLSG